MSYVLTVIRDNILDVCETFEYQQDAIESGMYFCDFSNIEKSNNTFDSKMNGWVLADNGIYFVSVVQRMEYKSVYMIGSSYGTFLDTLTAARRGGGYGTYVHYDPITRKDLINQQTVTHSGISTAPISVEPLVAIATLKTSLDNPSESTLPGGFSGTKNRHMTVADVFDRPHEVTSTLSLNVHEKWALVTARARKRPNLLVLLPGQGLYSQKYILEELEKKSAVGLLILAQQLNEIQKIYDDAIELQEESSSSSESEDLD